MTHITLSIAVPCFNEENNILETVATLESVLKDFPNIKYEIIVIDDGSTDSTRAKISSIVKSNENILLIANDENKGLGFSIRAAINESKGTYFLVIPGDNDISKYVLNLLFLNIGKADLVMLYFQNTEIRGRLRYFLSSFFKVLYITTFNLYLIYLNGPAIYPSRYLKKLELRSNRFSIVAEMNVKTLRMGLTFMEVPCQRLNNMKDSKSFSLRNLVEAVKIYAFTVIDVFILKRDTFTHIPKRVVFQHSKDFEK